MFKKETYVDIKNDYKQDEFGRDTTQPHLYKHTINVYDGTNDVLGWIYLPIDTPITNTNIETYIDMLNVQYDANYNIFCDNKNESFYISDAVVEISGNNFYFGDKSFALAGLVIHDDVGKVF